MVVLNYWKVEDKLQHNSQDIRRVMGTGVERGTDLLKLKKKSVLFSSARERGEVSILNSSFLYPLMMLIFFCQFICTQKACYKVNLLILSLYFAALTTKKNQNQKNKLALGNPEIIIKHYWLKYCNIFNLYLAVNPAY